MPSLVMRAPAGSLLDADQPPRRPPPDRSTAPSAASRGASRSRRTTRATSSSPTSTRTSACPGSGSKRGLSEDLVVAPYATALARDGRRRRGGAELRAARRGRRHAAATASTRRSTTRRAALPEGATCALVRAYMAHHQGMTLVAIANALHGGAMRARFHAEPIVQATELLLQERTPRDVAVARPAAPKRSRRRRTSAISRRRCCGAPFAARSDAARPTCCPTAATR